MNVQVNPNKADAVEILSIHDQISLLQLISKLCQYDNWINPILEVELDYGDCFYEGDKPSAKLVLRGLRPKTPEEIKAEKLLQRKKKSK